MAKKARNKDMQRWIFCSKEPTFCLKCQVVQFAQKLRKANFLIQTLNQISKKVQFLGQRWDHKCPYHLST